MMALTGSLNLQAILYLKNTLGRKNYETKLDEAHESGQRILYQLISETPMDNVSAKIEEQIYIVYGGLIKCNIARYKGDNLRQDVNNTIQHLKENTLNKLTYMDLVLQEISDVEFGSSDFQYLTQDLINIQQSV